MRRLVVCIERLPRNALADASRSKLDRWGDLYFFTVAFNN